MSGCAAEHIVSARSDIAAGARSPRSSPCLLERLDRRSERSVFMPGRPPGVVPPVPRGGRAGVRSLEERLLLVMGGTLGVPGRARELARRGSAWSARRRAVRPQAAGPRSVKRRSCGHQARRRGWCAASAQLLSSAAASRSPSSRWSSLQETGTLWEPRPPHRDGRGAHYPRPSRRSTSSGWASSSSPGGGS
jgi:hypothetical protein